MNISWDDAQLFLAVADTGSFSGAARQLSLGQPTVSRRIADMEYHLGWPLFHRGRRGAELTEEGERLLPAARQMGRWAGELERAIAEKDDEASGTVRITAPPGTAFDFLVPFTRWLREEEPGIRLQILASVEYLDLLRGQAELAIRNRPTEQPGIVTLAEQEFSVAPYASDEYVDGLPEDPDPREIDWIGWAPPFEHLSPNPELRQLFPGFQPSFAADDYLIQAQACRQGLGVMFLPRIEHPLVNMSGLQEVPLDMPEVRGSIYLICAHNMQYVPRVRAVSQALIQQLEAASSG